MHRASKIILILDIKVWMLTGDKLETAESIARSCNLITPKMKVLYFDKQKDEEIKKQMKDNQLEAQNHLGNLAIIVEGTSLGISKFYLFGIIIFLN